MSINTNTHQHGSNVHTGSRKGTPKVSIGLPTYNGELHLRESIESILSQDFEDFELLISDNASTDRTWQICKEYAAQDKRIRLYRHEKNHGIFKNFDFVFRNTTAPYFMWHAHDDLLGKGYISRLYETLSARSDHVLCCSQNLLINGDGSLTKLSRDLTIDSESMIARFRRCFDALPTIGLTFYGLIRREALASLTIDRPLYGIDFIIPLELSLIGKFFQAPDAFRQYRLKRPEARQQRTSYYYGTRVTGLLPSYTHTQMMWALVQDVMASPIASSTKLAFLAAIGARMGVLARWLHHDCCDFISSATLEYPRTHAFLKGINHRLKLGKDKEFS